MEIQKLTGFRHCHQPYRDLWDTALIPLEVRYSGRIYDRALIPNLYSSNPKDKYVDYNKEITAQCYEPCAKNGVDSKMPFNMSPSLLRDLWIRERNVYDSITESEKRSFDRFHGHSNAIAQASPNHIIMPLAKDEDKRLYVLHSIEEYEKHFGRFPEGMWLPEAAVDKKTLSVLADLGIKYVILAPRQAKRVRPVFSGENSWHNVEGGTIDISKPYKMYFENTKKEIAVFFYDKGFSGDLGFPTDHTKWIYHSPENFINRWLSIWGNFKHFAVDGETFGHHHKGKAELLADALKLAEISPSLELTNYGLYLEQNPPKWDVEIVDNSSWSCEHGLVRWGKKFNHEGENCREGTLGSEWRVAMRDAFDRLAIDLDKLFVRHVEKYYKYPQKALEAYGSVTADKQTFYEYFETHGKKGLSGIQIEEAYMIMEMQRLKLNMFTSCGWFHDYVGRPEPFANFLFAYSAVQVAKRFEPYTKIESRFLEEPDRNKMSAVPDVHYEKAKADMKQVYKDAAMIMKEYKKEVFKLEASIAA